MKLNYEATRKQLMQQRVLAAVWNYILEGEMREKGAQTVTSQQQALKMCIFTLQ